MPVNNPVYTNAGGDLSGQFPNPLVVGLSGTPIAGIVPVSGQVLEYNGTNYTPTTISGGGGGAPSGPAGGDLSGTFPNPQVNSINGVNISGNPLTQYLYLPGLAGGQLVHGGASARATLTLDSTANATKGNITVAPSGGYVGVNTVTPSGQFQVLTSDGTGRGFLITGAASDNTTDNNNGAVIGLSHNSGGNRQIYLGDSANFQGIRVLGSTISGINFQPGTTSGLDLGIGAQGNRTLFPAAFGTNATFAFDNQGQTLSNPTMQIRGQFAQTGHLFGITRDANGGTPTDGILCILPSGSVGIGTNAPTHLLEVAGPVAALSGFVPGQLNGAGYIHATQIYSGSGVPSNSFGSSGNFYLRTDTPGTASQNIYVKNAGTWSAIV